MVLFTAQPHGQAVLIGRRQRLGVNDQIHSLGKPMGGGSGFRLGCFSVSHRENLEGRS